MKMKMMSFMRFFIALGATVNLSLVSRHGALLSAHASPESSSSLSSLPTTTLAGGVEGKVWQEGVEVLKDEGEGSNQPQAVTTTMEDTRLRTSTTRGGRQGLSSSSRLERLLSKSSWRKLSKALVSVSMAVTVASLLLTVRKISSMCTAKLRELKGQAAGGSVPEICRTLGLAQSQGEEALAQSAKDKTVQGENFFQKLLETRLLSQQAVAVAVALLLISLASTAHAAERVGYGTKPNERGYAKRYFVFERITCPDFNEGRHCDVIYEDANFWQMLFYRYHEREIHYIVKVKNGKEYHHIYRFSDDFIAEMEKLGIPYGHRYWLAYEWADQIGREEGQVTGSNVPLPLWYKRRKRSS